MRTGMEKPLSTQNQPQTVRSGRLKDAAIPNPAPNPLNISHDTPGPRLQFGSSAGFVWTRLELELPDLPHSLNGFRILHLSDLHTRRSWDPAYDTLIARINAA